MISRRRPPVWVLAFLAGAIFLLLGAGNYWFSGASDMARFGGIGALVALFIVLVFWRK